MFRGEEKEKKRKKTPPLNFLYWFDVCGQVSADNDLPTKIEGVTNNGLEKGNSKRTGARADERHEIQKLKGLWASL